MSIIWYLLIRYNKFSDDALFGFSIIGVVEMIIEFALLANFIL